MTEPLDVLETLGLELACPICGCSYRVPLKTVAISQRMLHDGCPVSDERECAPIFYGPLIEPEVLKDLEAAWSKLETRAQKTGGHIVILN